MATLQERAAEAKKRAAAAAALITDSEREDAALRAEMAKDQEAEREALAFKRSTALAVRLDKLIEGGDDPDELKTVQIKGFPDTFIVKRNGVAHAQWEKSTVDSGTNKKIDRAEVSRRYARLSIVAWNDVVDFNDTVNTHNLDKYLTKYPGIVTPITNAAALLNGVFAEEAKSTD